MAGALNSNAIIRELFNRYKAKGFITDEEVLSYCDRHTIPLGIINLITDQLLSKGVIIENDDFLDSNRDESYDKTRTDYDEVFNDALQASPNLSFILDYLKGIRPPKRREWHMLIQQAQGGNLYARDRILDMYLRVVIKLSLKYHKKSDYELDDVFQVGVMGLLHAINAYDFSRHGNFVSYMPLWISQYIQRSIDDLSRPIRLPVHMRMKIRNLQKTVAELTEKSLSRPTTKEIAHACQTTEDSIKKVLRYAKNTISIENFLSKDRSTYYLYDREDVHNPPIEDIFERSDLRRVLIELLDSLPEVQSRVLCLRFGFYDQKPRTLENVALILGVTRERIRQIETKALKRLALPSNIIKLDGYYDICQNPIGVHKKPALEESDFSLEPEPPRCYSESAQLVFG